jgi:hypothetical protein
MPVNGKNLSFPMPENLPLCRICVKEKILTCCDPLVFPIKPFYKSTWSSTTLIMSTDLLMVWGLNWKITGLSKKSMNFWKHRNSLCDFSNKPQNRCCSRSILYPQVYSTLLSRPVKQGLCAHLFQIHKDQPNLSDQ